MRQRTPDPPAAAEPAAAVRGAGSIRIGTLMPIRWFGIAGQALALVVVYYGLGFPLPFEMAMVAVGTAALVNVGAMLAVPRHARLSEPAAAGLLGFDIVQLSVLLYLTGGLGNPFCFLLLAPVTVSATILGLRPTVALCALTLIAISVLAVWHLPLPWTEEGLSLPIIYIAGLWSSLVLGIIFVASYAWQVAEEARRMSGALAATQLALAREQRISALGTLAAAAAHELGTPLGTIAVVAREVARALPPDGPLAEDVQLLLEQTARCRDILADLAHQPEDDTHEAFERMPMATLVEVAAEPYHGTKVDIVFAEAGEEELSPPLVGRSLEVIHGLGNLVQNAVQFAATRVDVETRWSRNEIAVTIRDDGPGFPAGAIDRLGEPYFSTRSRRGGHMGLGVFIARTLLERTGAQVTFANRIGRSGPEGAVVTVRWSRPMTIETEASARSSLAVPATTIQD